MNNVYILQRNHVPSHAMRALIIDARLVSHEKIRMIIIN